MSSLLTVFFGINSLMPLYHSQNTVMDIVVKNCSKINPDVVMGIIKTESKFNGFAMNQDSIGLMQVRYETAKRLKCDQDPKYGLFSAVHGIRCGCQYLYYQLDRYKFNYKLAVSAYNSGTAFFKKDRSLRNQKYVDNVFLNKKLYGKK